MTFHVFIAYIIIISYYDGPPVWSMDDILISRPKKQIVTGCYTGPWSWQSFVDTVMNIRVP